MAKSAERFAEDGTERPLLLFALQIRKGFFRRKSFLLTAYTYDRAQTNANSYVKNWEDSGWRVGLLRYICEATEENVLYRF